MTNDESALDYTTYLAVDELLRLQRPLSPGPEPDELLFITIHQVYELWFKQMLHELALLQHSLESADGFAAYATLNRLKAILAVCIQQVDVLTTMTPLQFGAFRDRLETASGFQSAQFREIEAVFGRRDARFAEHLLPKDRARVAQRMYERSLWDSMLVFVKRCGFDVPDDVLHRDYSMPYESNAAVRAALAVLHREHHEATHLCEQLIDLEVGLNEWRYRHVLMVERTIGSKTGTGGSDGSGYLRSTLTRSRAFPELWEIRAEF